jgi:ribonuclease HI
LNQQVIEIYTDGSCHTNFRIGAWVAILFVSDEKIVLKGEVLDTTHNRMELMAAIKAIEFADSNYKNVTLKIYTDSQYLTRLRERRVSLQKKLFDPNKNGTLQNSDLIKILIYQIENHSIEFVKVKAHQKSVAGHSNPSVGFHTEADKLARKMVRGAVKQHHVNEAYNCHIPG